MKHVTFIKPMAPHHVGDRRIVPDLVADRLAEEGAIAPNPEPWPPGSADIADVPPAPRHRRRHSYLTKDAC